MRPGKHTICILAALMEALLLVCLPGGPTSAKATVAVAGAVDDRAAPAATDAFARGLTLFDSGQWERAAEVLFDAAVSLPDDPVVQLTAGVALANVRRCDKAIGRYIAAARVMPEDPLIQFLLEGCYSQLGQAQEANQTRIAARRALQSEVETDVSGVRGRLEQSLQNFPENAIAHCLLGDWYYLHGDVAKAVDQYAEASDLAPGWHKPLFNMGIANLAVDPKTAESNLLAAQQLSPSNGRVQLYYGDALLKQRRYDEAIQAYENAARNQELQGQACTRLGNAYLQKEDYAAARSNFENASKLVPADPVPVAGKADVYLNTGHLSEAEKNYTAAAQVLQSNQADDKSIALIQNRIGITLLQQGRQAEAEAVLSSAYRLMPTRSNAEALVRLHQRENVLPAQVEGYKAVLTSKPRDIAALTYLFCAYRLTGNNRGVIEMARRLIEADPAGAGDYYARIAEAQMALGAQEEAVRACCLGLAAGAEHWPVILESARQCGLLGILEDTYAEMFAAERQPAAGVVLFEIQAARGNLQGMLDTAQVLVNNCPDEPAFWLRLGEAHERIGNLDKAAAAYSKADSFGRADTSSVARARIEAVKSRSDSEEAASQEGE